MQNYTTFITFHIVNFIEMQQDLFWIVIDTKAREFICIMSSYVFVYVYLTFLMIKEMTNGSCPWNFLIIFIESQVNVLNNV